MENDFRRSQRVSQTDMERYQRQQQEMKKTRSEVKYTAPKGTAAKAKKNKTKPRTRIAALILAAAIGVGGITLANVMKQDSKEEIPTITQIQQGNADIESLGLSQDTLELFEKYDEYFEDVDSQELKENNIFAMISGIKGLHFSVVKEKMSNLTGVSVDDIKMYYRFEKADGEYSTSVVLNKDKYNEKTYRNIGRILGVKVDDENTIPDEISNIILQLERLDDIESNLENDRISKANAVKELEKLYQELTKVATSDLIMDEKGNISIIEYASQEQQEEIEER